MWKQNDKNKIKCIQSNNPVKSIFQSGNKISYDHIKRWRLLKGSRCPVRKTTRSRELNNAFVNFYRRTILGKM